MTPQYYEGYDAYYEVLESGQYVECPYPMGTKARDQWEWGYADALTVHQGAGMP